MKIFLDFEASSLSKESYPVELGWVDESGQGEAMLIRPAAGWTEWDDSAAAIHGISRAELDRDGVTCAAACERLIALAEGNILYASAPSWDGHWLSMLLRGAGLPRHLLRLRDTEEAFAEAARERLGENADAAAVAALISAARVKVGDRPAHRALADARREWSIWRAVKDG